MVRSVDVLWEELRGLRDTCSTSPGCLVWAGINPRGNNGGKGLMRAQVCGHTHDSL